MLNWWPNKVVHTQHLWCFICQQHDTYGNARMGQQLGQSLRIGKDRAHSLACTIEQKLSPLIFLKNHYHLWHWKASYPQNFEWWYIPIHTSFSIWFHQSGEKWMQLQFCKWDENTLNGFWVSSRWANHVIDLWPVMSSSWVKAECRTRQRSWPSSFFSIKVSTRKTSSSQIQIVQNPTPSSVFLYLVPPNRLFSSFLLVAVHFPPEFQFMKTNLVSMIISDFMLGTYFSQLVLWMDIAKLTFMHKKTGF